MPILPLVLVALPALAQPQPTAVEIQAFDGLGTPSSFHLWGRVLNFEGRLPDLIRLQRAGLPSPFHRPIRFLESFDTDEAQHVRVFITVDGTTYSAMTDDDGNYELLVRGLPRPLPPGPYAFQVDVADPSRHVVVRGGTGVLHVLPEEGVAVISDIDDTVVQTHVTDKIRLLSQALMRNPDELKPVPGVAKAYQEARDAGALAFFYVSGSPQNLQPRLRAYLQHNKVPEGPLLLKNLGQDDLNEQEAYKLRRIEALLEAYPRLRFVLVGDDGERDPEIYREILRRHPERSFSVVIRTVRNAKAGEARYQGMTVVPNYSADAQLIAREVARLASLKAAAGPTR